MTDSAPVTASQADLPGIDLNRFPWNRPLVTACLRDFPSVSSLFAGNPSDRTAWRDTIGRAQGSARDHGALSRVLVDQLTKRNAPLPAREAAVALADARTVAIVTGQQAGLFGGPLYTILKAITAIQLARRLEQQEGIRAVPVFWVEVEDHDWDEVRTVHLLDAEHNLRHLTADDPPGAGRLAVGRLSFDARIDDTVSQTIAALPPSAFTAELHAQLARHYRAGATMAEAFAGLMDDLFGPHGMVVFEAHDPAAKPLVGDLFVEELAHAGRTTHLALEAAAAMQRLGHAPQIEPVENSVALFYFTAEARLPIKRRDGDFTIGETVRTAADLIDEAASHPERFSPNVLLRPLVQDRLFPAVCYVGGPAEIAYQAQLGANYRALGVEQPLLFPRVSTTLLDSAAVRFLERHNLSLEDLHADEESVLKRIIEQSLPTDVEDALRLMQEATTERAGTLKNAILRLDPTLTGAVDTTLDRIRDTLQSLHGKIIQAGKRNDETLRRQFKRTYALVFPGGAPQERVLGSVFFLNRYGPGLIQKLIDVLPLDTDQHYALTL